jgi:hypothetical protein
VTKRFGDAAAFLRVSSCGWWRARLRSGLPLEGEDTALVILDTALHRQIVAQEVTHLTDCLGYGDKLGRQASFRFRLATLQSFHAPLDAAQPLVGLLNAIANFA